LNSFYLGNLMVTERKNLRQILGESFAVGAVAYPIMVGLTTIANYGSFTEQLTDDITGIGTLSAIASKAFVEISVNVYESIKYK